MRDDQPLGRRIREGVRVLPGCGLAMPLRGVIPGFGGVPELHTCGAGIAERSRNTNDRVSMAQVFETKSL